MMTRERDETTSGSGLEPDGMMLFDDEDLGCRGNHGNDDHESPRTPTAHEQSKPVPVERDGVAHQRLFCSSRRIYMLATVLVCLLLGLFLSRHEDPPGQHVQYRKSSQRKHRNPSTRTIQNPFGTARSHAEPSCPNNDYTNGQWNENGTEWILDNPQVCRLEPFSIPAFCRALSGRSLLFVGDSINLQFYHALVTLLGKDRQKDVLVHQKQKFGKARLQVHLSVGGFCEGLDEDPQQRLTFVRNDYLTTDQTLEQNVTSAFIAIPWLHFLADHQVLVLNTGAHAVEIQAYKRRMKELREYLVRSEYEGTVVFRTTPRGHAGCSDSDKPIVDANGREWERFFGRNGVDKLLPHHWHRFPVYNRIIFEVFDSDGSQIGNKSLLAAFQVLDVSLLTELRPDQHKTPPIDCLHYKSIDVYKVWVLLLTNALYDNLS